MVPRVEEDILYEQYNLSDHNGLFVFVDGEYPKSYHDVMILKNLVVEQNWRWLFTNIDDYCEYVLGDQSYIGLEKYIM